MAPGRHEIAARLRRQITEQHKYKPGDTLPRAVDLAAQLGVSKIVVGNAYKLLEQEGLVEVVRRKGTVVRAYQRNQVTRTRRVHRDEWGYSFDQSSIPWRLLQHFGVHRVTAPPHVAELLELEQPAPVVVMRDRLLGVPRQRGQRRAQPMQLATTYIPVWLVEQLPILDQPYTGAGGVLDRIEEASDGPLTWTEYLLADSASHIESKRLAVPPGAALLRIATVSYSPDRRPVEVTVRSMDGARFRAGPFTIGRHQSAAWPPTPATLPEPQPMDREQS